jgi:signal transduction histidine kinase/ActR/RegA family two-component response regulator
VASETVRIHELPYAAAIIDESGELLDRNGSFLDLVGSCERLSEVLAAIDTRRSPWKPSGTDDTDRVALLNGPIIRLTGRDGVYRMAMVPVAGGAQLYVIDVLPHDGVIDVLLRSNDDGVFILDEQSTIGRCNEIALEFTAGETAIGRNADDAIRIRRAGSPFPVSALARQAHRQRTELIVSSDITAVTQSGIEIEVELSIHPVVDSLSHTVIRVRNAGERRRLWQEMRRVQHAEDIARAATGIAHELNNSGTTLISQLGLIGKSGAPAPRLLRDTEAAVRRVRRLAFQLERFSNAPSRDRADDRSREYLSPERVSELIQDTVALAVSGSSIQASFVIAPDLAGVSMPAGELSQALFNVLVNAVDAMSEGGLLHVEAHARRRSNTVEIVVRDEGDGMDPRIVRDVLKPYFSTKSSGTGMGLTVAYSVVRAAGGTIEIDTNPGFGTSVTLCLPAVDPESGTIAISTTPSQEAAIAEEGGVDVSRMFVLLVEDDPLVRRSMERTLQSAGCRVDAVSSGERALEAFRERVEGDDPYTILMTDLTMPGRYDGVQLLRLARELDPEIPAVLCSGVLHRSNISDYRSAGFQSILRKPFGVQEIVAAIHEALTTDG